MKIKKGDMVIVIAGKDRGERGKVVRVVPKKDLVVVDGVNILKKHRRRTARSRAGQIVDKTMPIHISNVQLLDPKSGKASRVRIERKEGARTRVAVKSGSAV